MEYLVNSLYSLFWTTEDWHYAQQEESLSFTPIELIFLKSVSYSLQINPNNNLFYLGTSDSMQNGFQNHVRTNFSVKGWTAKELDLEPIISSIWTKSKAYIQSQLLKSNNLEEINDEIKWQIMAEKLISGCQDNGHTGLFFTTRQINLLLEVAEKKPVIL